MQFKLSRLFGEQVEVSGKAEEADAAVELFKKLCAALPMPEAKTQTAVVPKKAK